MITAITSISPNHINNQQNAINTWVDLGFNVVSLNTISEINLLRPLYKFVKFVETTNTQEVIFGKPLVKINELINYAGRNNIKKFLIINSDIELSKDYVTLSAINNELNNNSFIFGIRHDYLVDKKSTTFECGGFDYFFMTNELIKYVSDSEFCIGQCWWDYWLPVLMIKNKIKSFCIYHNFAFHKDHKKQWNQNQWEFAYKWFENENTELVQNMNQILTFRANEIRNYILSNSQQLNFTNMKINFNSQLKKYGIAPIGIIQAGVHKGQEIQSHIDFGFNNIALIEPQPKPFDEIVQIVSALEWQKRKFKTYNCAVSDKDGKMTMYIETENDGESSSLLKPKEHLNKFPNITFDNTIKVEVKTLDKLIEEKSNYNVLYFDIQGSELAALNGATDLLKNIDALFLEVNFIELYENCPMVEDIDKFLSYYGFTRIQTGEDFGGWSDAIYIRNEFIDNANVEDLGNDENFVESDYLELNPDVANAIKNGQFGSGREHYEAFGRNENRKTCF